MDLMGQSITCQAPTSSLHHSEVQCRMSWIACPVENALLTVLRVHVFAAASASPPPTPIRPSPSPTLVKQSPRCAPASITVAACTSGMM
jgi:hypothetical protein